MEKLVLNITVFIVRTWGFRCKEELVLNITGFFVSV
jgi:hypothetical protein